MASSEFTLFMSLCCTIPIMIWGPGTPDCVHADVAQPWAEGAVDGLSVEGGVNRESAQAVDTSTIGQD
jgi:accessory colonization factor AcfC